MLKQVSQNNKVIEVNSLNITYTTYEDEYHFLFNFNSGFEVIFAIKDSNMVTFLNFITEILDNYSKYSDIIFKEDINNLEVSCTSRLFFMRRDFNIKYDDVKISFNVNIILLNELQKFRNNFIFHPKPIDIDNNIKKELENYINSDKEKHNKKRSRQEEKITVIKRMKTNYFFH